MEQYVFVCVGTNRLIEDSFGPRVGDALECNFRGFDNINVLGTMKSPIHFQNAPIFLDYLQAQRSKVILIDSALGNKNEIGDTYMSLGGAEIGKAFGKSFYFPAYLSVKTVVGLKKDINTNQVDKKRSLIRVKELAQKVAHEITNIIYEI